MNFPKSSATLLSLLTSLSLLACSEESPDDQISTDELISMSGKADHASISTGDLCNLVCDVLRPGVDACFGNDACHEFCDDQSERLQGAAMVEYITCANENPLCYQEMESCIWYGLTEVEDKIVSVVGSGFPAYQDFNVYASMKDRNNVEQFVDGVVIEGRFALKWPSIFTAAYGESVLYYVDINDDGECTPGVDQGGLAYVTPTDNYLAPEWVAYEEATPPTQGKWVCDYFN